MKDIEGSIANRIREELRGFSTSHDAPSGPVLRKSLRTATENSEHSRLGLRIESRQCA